MLALAHALRRRGARVLPSFSAPFELASSLAELPGAELLVPPETVPAAPALLVTLDTGSADRLGSLAPLVDSAAEVLVVDHHASNTRYGTLHLVDPAAAATAVLVEELVRRLGVELDADTAACLYAGLVTDTGSFRFASTTPETHELAARLLRTGIRHDLITRRLLDTHPAGWLGMVGAALVPGPAGAGRGGRSRAGVDRDQAGRAGRRRARAGPGRERDRPGPDGRRGRGRAGLQGVRRRLDGVDAVQGPGGRERGRGHARRRRAPVRGRVRLRRRSRDHDGRRPHRARGRAAPARMTPAPEPGGLVVVDKPAGWTSHDVVARVRKIAGTRRVGHAGTLDPMATGVLVLGVERATKLLGHLTLTDKSYAATIRLGQDTVTDDAEGEPTGGASAAAVTEPDLAAGAGGADRGDPAGPVRGLGDQGRRPALVRAGAGRRGGRAGRAPGDRVPARAGRLVPPDAPTCSTSTSRWTAPSGTYVRALARDLGRALGTGGHLTALRRTRVGPFTLADALTLDELAERADPVPIPLDAAVAAAFPRRELTEVETDRLRHGGRLDPLGRAGPVRGVRPGRPRVALVEDRAGGRPSAVVFRPA